MTDRTQLEQQLSETSQSIGFSVKVADSIRTLKELLRSDSSDLVMAMIHKFRETDLTQTFPELNASPHILVMTDEAHRSQYAMLGANLDKGIPNAARIGYTGTPIDKTERVFGDYIDKYTMRQSIEDGVTLEIVYEGRTHNAEVADQTGMDTAFADVSSEYNLQERMEILGYGSRDAYLEAKSTIEAKAGDMVKHYLTHVFPNGYKAQVVAVSREAAVRYKTYIDAALVEAIASLKKDNPNNIDLERLKKLRTDVIISGGHNDLPRLKAYADKSKHERSIKSFKLPFDGEDEGITGDMGIVIVRDMLLTGFDAPMEQVMYLDKVIVAHNLLQAIARVNRVGGEGKDKGFVVDYVGIGHHLDVDLGDDPDLQASFAEALKKILEDFQKNWKKIYEELEKLRQRIIKAQKEPTYGLHRKKQMPLFRMFRREIFRASDNSISQASPSAAGESPHPIWMTEEDKISHLVDLTQKTFLVVERELKLTGFWESIPARNKLKADLQRILLAPDFARLPKLITNRAHIISRVMEIAEKNNDIILYAEQHGS